MGKKEYKNLVDIFNGYNFSKSFWDFSFEFSITVDDDNVLKGSWVVTLQGNKQLNVDTKA